MNLMKQSCLPTENIDSVEINANFGYPLPNSFDKRPAKDYEIKAYINNLKNTSSTEIQDSSENFKTDFQLLLLRTHISLKCTQTKEFDARCEAISILTKLSKVFEKLLRARLNSCLDQYKCISTLQYGFEVLLKALSCR